MATTVRLFLESLQTHGVVSSDTAASWKSKHSNDADASELAKELVRSGALTKFQAAAAYQGKLRDLILGNYVLLEKLGEGGMGQVFKARHLKMDRLVAIKVLPRKLLNSKAAIERFHREVKAAAKLVHQNIVAAFDADEADGRHFLVMEYVEGFDVSQMVRVDGPLPLSKTLKILLGAALGLRHAHAQGMVHRDIKPSNLLVDTAGNVKILDMGLARLDTDTESVLGGNSALGAGSAIGGSSIGSPGSIGRGSSIGPGSSIGSGSFVGTSAPQNDLTQDGSVMGTIDYMAPEQAVDAHTTDNRGDIYSLGCTMHFMLVGRPPFRGDSVAKRLLAHRDSPIPQLRELRRDVPEALDGLFQRMMAKRAADRPKSLDEVVQVLESLQTESSRRAKRRSMPMLAGVAAGGAVLVGLIVAAIMMLSGDDDGATSVAQAAMQPPAAVATKPAASAARVATPAASVAPTAAVAGVPAPAASPTGLPTAVAAPTPAAPAAVIAFNLPTTPEPPPAVASSTAPPNDPPVPVAPATVAVVTPPASAPSVVAPRERAAVPDAAEVKKLDAKLKELYAQELKEVASSALSPLPVIDKLLLDATTTADVTLRYARLELARSLAIKQENPGAMRTVSTAVAEAFEQSELAHFLGALRDAGTAARDAAAAKRLCEAALDATEEAVDAEDFDVAKALLEAARTTAGKSRSPDHTQRVSARTTKLAVERTAYEDAKKAAVVLEASPDDPGANLRRGRYVCFVRQDWEAGLPLLAKGTDLQLKDLAAKKPAAANDPKALAAVGDDWWDAAQKKGAADPRRKELLLGAAYWYLSAQPLLIDADVKKLVDGRLATIGDAGRRRMKAASVDLVAVDKLPPQLTIWLKPDVPIVLQLIQPGKFMMGSPPGETGRAMNEPLRDVTISRPFYIGVFELTHDQWEALIPGDAVPRPRQPKGLLSYVQCLDYLRRLNQSLPQKGAEFRLPTEAEWEYACRAGTTTPFYFGSTLSGLQANFNSGQPYGAVPPMPSAAKALEVGKYPANAWGLYDMHGNLSEFCSDWEGGVSREPQVDPLGPEFGQRRIYRGGQFDQGGFALRSANRMSETETHASTKFGMRVVLGTPLDVIRKANGAPTSAPPLAAPSPGTPPTSAASASALDAGALPQDLTFALEIGNPLALRLLPAGKFLMGSPFDEPGREAGESQHEVTLTRPFYIGKYEVTYRQWFAVMGKTEVKPTRAGPEGPAIGVGFDAANNFCAQLNKTCGSQHTLSGYEFRLPTEAEWEYACRAGTTTASYVASGITTKDANFDKSVGGRTPVGTYPPNPWGLYDLFGNTAEWVLDENGPYGPQPAVDPIRWVGSGARILRGGSDVSPPNQMRAAERRPTKPDGVGGLRVVFGPILPK